MNLRPVIKKITNNHRFHSISEAVRFSVMTLSKGHRRCIRSSYTIVNDELAGQQL